MVLGFFNFYFELERMEKRVYEIGLLKNPKLIVERDDVFEYYLQTQDSNIIVKCNKSDLSIRISMGDESTEQTDGIEKNEVKQLYEDGSRWEGDWYNEKPFGFGSYFDGVGNRIYSGFMFDGKKVGFGTEFFSDTHTVDYCGNFMNDKRHGWGTTYDRNGNILYEGDWRCGKNCDFEEKIVIKDNCEEDDLRIHDLIKELEIGENCYNECKDDLVIENYPNLQSIVVKRYSLKYLNSLKICNCEKLKIIETEDGEEWTSDCIWHANGAFFYVKNVIIESIPEMNI